MNPIISRLALRKAIQESSNTFPVCSVQRGRDDFGLGGIHVLDDAFDGDSSIAIAFPERELDCDGVTLDIRTEISACHNL